MKLCSYGCGRIAIKFFKNGKGCCDDSRNKCPSLREKNRHSQYGRVHSEETKQKMSKNMSGLKKSKPILLKDNKNIFCYNNCGQLANYKFSDNYWCSDHVNKCPKSKENNSIKSKQKYIDKPELKNKLKEGIKKSWTKKDRIESHYKLLDRNKNNPEYIKKLKKSLKETYKDPELRKLLSNLRKEDWKNPEYRKKIFKSNKGPNKFEKKILDLLGTDFKFVGDQDIIIDGKNPDFISLKEKKLVEGFGDYWHGEQHRQKHYNDFSSNEEHEKQRIKHFEKNYYKCLVIWESEIKDIKKLKNKIKRFINI